MKKTVKKAKKTTKVKKNVVKKKKKTTKKKTPKKKVVKKKVTRSRKKVVKSVKKKKKSRQRKKKIYMEDIYSILNKVQIAKKKITFATDFIESATIENTVKDAQVDYKKVEMKTQVVFTLTPNDEKYAQEEPLNLEIMDDEIPDIGQIFG